MTYSIKRKISQFISLIALHSSRGPEVKWLCNPVLSCHSCVLSYFACPIGVLVHFSGYQVFPFLIFGTILLFGSLIGRLLCGWVCPFGLFQDLLHKIPSKKFMLPKWTYNIKYAILIVMVFLIPYFFGELTWYSFCRICPAATLQVSIPTWIGSGFNLSLSMIVRLYVLFAVIVLAIFVARGFCKTICPIGALLSPLNYLSLWKVKVPNGKCISCQKCDSSCDMKIKPSKNILKGIPANRDLDCTLCYECKDACPARTGNNAL